MNNNNNIHTLSHERIATLAKESIRRILLDTVCASEVNEAQIRQDFSPDYVQVVDGKKLNLDGLIHHMKIQKQHIQQAKITFVALCAEGHTVFSHHIVSAVKADGSLIKAEVIAHFNVDEHYRVLQCLELTRLIEGSEEDKDLGSRT